MVYLIGDLFRQLRYLPMPTQHVPAHSADILEICRRHYSISAQISHGPGGLPGFGNRWDAFKRDMADKIANFQDAAEAIRFAQTEGNFDNRGRITPQNINSILVADHLVRYEYPKFAGAVDDFMESSFSAPGTVVRLTRRGKTVAVSDSQYWQMCKLLSMLDFDQNIESCCEIGGGYGDLARLFATNSIRKIKHYCIIDIPETLFFSELFLRACLPDARFVYVTGEDFDFDDIDNGQPTLIFCPVQFHTATKKLKFDYLINTGSLAEMPDEWVAFWGTWIDQQQARYFYSHNYFGNPVERIYEGRSMFAPILSDPWELAYIRPMHPLMMLHSTERKATELIFVKNGVKSKKIGLSEFISFAYSFQRHPNLKEAIEFVDSVRVDFGYDPVELTWILKKIIAHEQFDSLDQPTRARVTALHTDLLQRYVRCFPKGTQDS